MPGSQFMSRWAYSGEKRTTEVASGTVPRDQLAALVESEETSPIQALVGDDG